ncbi:hypothetical protein LY78DRAFT_35790 [Colletotrichum sublineola]|nr:hypothetical protein LY78DRAFT_35790 [Colletotrichum sublineola]
MNNVLSRSLQAVWTIYIYISLLSIPLTNIPMQPDRLLCIDWPYRPRPTTLYVHQGSSAHGSATLAALIRARSRRQEHIAQCTNAGQRRIIMYELKAKASLAALASRGLRRPRREVAANHGACLGNLVCWRTNRLAYPPWSSM